MDKKFAIFDFDGTLVDSMSMWRALGLEFLDRYGVKYNRTELFNEIEKLTLPEAAELFIDKFSLDMSVIQAVEEMNNIVREHYKKDILLKEGMARFLNDIKEKDVHMCVVSVTEKSLIKLCLKRLGILDYFEFIFSCENMGLSKREATIYLEAAKKFNALPNEIAVYEDMLYSIKTAKKAGFYTVGVYDNQSKDTWDEICSLTDETLKL